MKLEHTAQYLPSRVNVLWKEGDNDLIGILTISDYSWLNSKGAKMVLRPLSDLTKEITHNGETFVPMDRLLDDWDWCVCDGVVCDTETLNDMPKYWPYHIVDNLIKHHFDVSGLIESGEAIDINTLSKH